MKLEESTEIISVSMIDVDTGEEKQLFEREGRKCHFRDPFSFGKYKIQLRLDWNDMEKGDPILDADLWTEDSIGRKTPLKKGSWHHTKKQPNPLTGEHQYSFEFQNLTLNLKTKMTVGKKHKADILVNDIVKVSKV
jgi:hypothetical protein